MARSERLLKVLQALRRRRGPVGGATLAEELGISIRTLYRDIESLRASGATIKGEAGVGYVLEPGFMLPPLMLSDRELEAMMLGMRWVRSVGDPQLVEAAVDASAKVSAVLPPALRRELDEVTLLVAPRVEPERETIDLETVRQALRAEHRLKIRYVDAKARETERVVWPIALAYFQSSRLLIAWCELREGFREFKTDRIRCAAPAGGRFERRRRALLKEWKASVFGDQHREPLT